MRKISSISKKVKTIISSGTNPILQGIRNHNITSDAIERMAKDRLEICKECVSFKKEPIPFLRIKDHKIAELSEMYCEDCGCSLPYKVRQNNNLCKKWKKQ